MATILTHIPFIPKNSDGLQTADLKDFYVKDFVEITTNIALYQNSAEENRVDKSQYLILIKTINGTFREGSSITNVVVTLELDSIPNFNYAYIPDFNRYYFINNIEFINNKLYTIYMSVDVLMSHKNAILECVAFIDRNEFRYNSSMIDDKRWFEEGCNIELVELPNNILKGEYTYVFEIADSKVQTYTAGSGMSVNYSDELIRNPKFIGEYI